ncbi:MAG TPA: aldo/keto reductase [Gemmatimonadaceae bacterium]|nr:aldo/keto reductase [Gemmatimonadaceae bacterium]
MTAKGTSATGSTYEPGSLISGRAAPEATHSYASRFNSGFLDDFYREAPSGLAISSIGMGTYLGECDDTEDQRYVELLAAGISNGLNLVDTAINYRCQRSERAVGQALRRALKSGSASRSDIVICTKGGYIPLDGAPPASRDEYKAYLTSEYFDRGIMSTADVVAGGHCLKPRFLSNQIQRSKANLGLDCIDVFYIHNPEQQLDVLSRSAFLDVIREAFAELEANVDSGKIGVYGCATWNGFRVFPANRNYLSLSELLGAAIDVGGPDHHFRVVQLPVNLAMTEAARLPTQNDGTTNLPLLEIAREFGVSVIGSAALMQSQLTHDLPPAVKGLFPGLETDAQRAITFARSLPVASALVGMKTLAHLDENLGAARSATSAPANQG